MLMLKNCLSVLLYFMFALPSMELSWSNFFYNLIKCGLEYSQDLLQFIIDKAISCKINTKCEKFSNYKIL